MAEMENSRDLNSVLWSGADVLRSKMDANEYKNYLLGIVFYKYLSDSFLIKVYDMICDGKPESLKEALDAYVEVLNGEDGEALKTEMKSVCHYVIEPELTYTYFADAARNNSFSREQLQKAFNNIEQSDELFVDLFTDIDLYSNRLGVGDQKQSDTIASLIKVIDNADLLNSDVEILGNAYETLIGWFASETGKKAGEFYTPQAVSKILTRIAIKGQEEKQGLSVYDPCMGSGSLLLNAKKYAKHSEYIKYYGQELNTSTYNLARMNMFLHGIVAENQKLHNGDTLDGDWPTGEETDFNMVLMNPPYSATENNQYPVLTSSRKGIFFQTDYYDGNQIASADNTGYNIVPYGYFTYRHMSDDEIFHFNINDIAENGIVSTLYPVFTTDENLDSRYLQYQLNYGREFARYAILQKQGGSRTYMYLNKLRNLYLTVPTAIEEQKKISEYFTNLDHLITLHQRKCNELKEIKKYMLQNMFV